MNSQKLFEGIGCFQNKQTEEPFKVRLDMDQETIPVMQKPRNVVYYLDQGVEEGIFKHVPHGELITWCSPLVAQPKQKYTNVEKEKLKPQMIRSSIDMQVPNLSMKGAIVFRHQEWKILSTSSKIARFEIGVPLTQ